MEGSYKFDVLAVLGGSVFFASPSSDSMSKLRLTPHSGHTIPGGVAVLLSKGSS